MIKPAQLLITTSKINIAETCIFFIILTGFTSDQCLQLVNLFSFDSEKIKLMQAMYPRIVDKPNFYLVIESLTFQSDKNKMNEFVRKYHNQRN